MVRSKLCNISITYKKQTKKQKQKTTTTKQTNKNNILTILTPTNPFFPIKVKAKPQNL